MRDFEHFDVIVVGAGISGLIASKRLMAAGLSVLVLEKARGPGGRLSRRRTARGNFDHGAQYFTARQPEFKSMVRQWLDQGLLKRWADGFASHEGVRHADGLPRFCGIDGMNSVAKDMSRGMNLRLKARVTRLERRGRCWQVTTEDPLNFQATTLLLTPPVPQSLELLHANQVLLEPELERSLQSVQYDPCLALMVAYDKPSKIPSPGGLWMPGEPVAWMADNALKAGPSDANGLLTIHTGPRFSREHWESSCEEAFESVAPHIAPWVAGNKILAQLHRWRYSKPVRSHPKSHLLAPGPPHLALAGDGFGSPRVEGAACSGMEVATAILSLHGM